jgi:hypothetical protein
LGGFAICGFEALKESYSMIKFKPFLLMFLVLVFLATLFPPYKWGEERVADVGGTYALPVKRYAFILGDSTRQFDKFDISLRDANDNGSRSVGPLTLQRSLIISDLILEYVIAFLIALMVAVLKIKHLLNHRT